MAHTIEDLRIKQKLPLDIKVNMTKQRIREWVEHYGIDGVYVSFSGGKDSTVLLTIARELYPDIKAVFVDTGLEYPEIRQFVKTWDNVDWIKPKMTFKQVIEKYGYPFISKEVSSVVAETCSYIDRQTPNNKSRSAILNELYGKTKLPVRALQLLGKLPHKSKGEYSGEYSLLYNKSKWLFLLDAGFKVSNKCCNVMKKAPAHAYDKETGRVPMTAQMADESLQRQSQWLQNGCNGFDLKQPISNPMSFWTEQDVLKYIKDNDIKICSVYGDIVPSYDNTEELDGQMDIADLGLSEDTRKLKTTGCDRTGCMFCGFGCHLEKEGKGRFERMKKTHPKQYEFIMKPREQGGLGYKEVIDWINEHGDLHIRY